MKNRYVLGVSMSSHDRSACLLNGGKVIGAVSEERVDRRKKSEGFYAGDRALLLPPMGAICYLLRENNLRVDDIELVVCGRSISSCREIFLKYFPILKDRVIEPEVPYHHLMHAYSAFGTMPFKDAAILVIDEQGHWVGEQFEKSSWFETTNDDVITIKKFWGDQRHISLGMFFDVIASVLDLKSAGMPSAGKLMGLSAYGKGGKTPSWPSILNLSSDDVIIKLDEVDNLLSLVGIRKINPSVKINTLDDLLLKYDPMPCHKNFELAGQIAYYAQTELEKAVMHIANQLKDSTNKKNLAYAGGVALNCIINSHLCECGWNDVFIHPAATDDGVAVGLAYYGWHKVLKQRVIRGDFIPFTGRTYSSDDALSAATYYGLRKFIKKAEGCEDICKKIHKGEVICRFSGKSEWGPRALGNRSIIASPLVPGIKDRINSSIKFRESFRPLAISSIMPYLGDILDLGKSPHSTRSYMLSVAPLKNFKLRGFSHVDTTIRYQIVHKEVQQDFFDIIECFGRMSDCYALINTSFNTFLEPIVESPIDAFRQYIISDADLLLIEGWQLSLKDIPSELICSVREKIFHEMNLPPLEIAFYFHHRGYHERALGVIQKITEEYPNFLQGRSDSFIRRYYVCLMQIYTHIGEVSKAYECAIQILKHSCFSIESKMAIEVMSSMPLSEKEKDFLKLVKKVASPGGGYDLFSKILG